jgi:hypothetical protein
VRPLADDELVAGESPIGTVPFSELGTTAAIDVPSRRRMLEGPDLVVTPPQGRRVEDPAVAEQAGRELGARLGGWFAGDLAPAIRLHDSLASDELRQLALATGTRLTLEAPRSAYYFAAFEEDGWTVQAAGEPADFHCVSLARPLTSEQALGPGGHPRPHPLGPPEERLREAAPGLPLDDLRDESGAHPDNLYDTYRSGPGVVVKAGVRLRLDANGAAAGGPTPALYAIRINLDLVG